MNTEKDIVDTFKNYQKLIRIGYVITYDGDHSNYAFDMTIKEINKLYIVYEWSYPTYGTNFLKSSMKIKIKDVLERLQ